MNPVNINKVIAAIQNEENFFNMADWVIRDEDLDQSLTIIALKGMGMAVPKCGTASCIGGWADELLKRERDVDQVLFEDIKDWLGIGPETANDLFYPDTDGFTPPSGEGGHGVDEWIHITRAQAIETLERLRDTGEVRWSWQNKE